MPQSSSDFASLTAVTAGEARIAYQGKPLDAYTKKDLIKLITLLIADYDLVQAELASCCHARDYARRGSSHGFLRGRVAGG